MSISGRANGFLSVYYRAGWSPLECAVSCDENAGSVATCVRCVRISRESGTVVAPSAERRRKRPMGLGIDGPNRDKSVFYPLPFNNDRYVCGNVRDMIRAPVFRSWLEQTVSLVVTSRLAGR
jgi:hypothetical protein